MKSEKSLESFFNMHNWVTPMEFRHTCFRDISIYPKGGLMGYVSYRNNSKVVLEMELTIDIEGAEIIWPS